MQKTNPLKCIDTVDRLLGKAVINGNRLDYMYTTRIDQFIERSYSAINKDI